MNNVDNDGQCTPILIGKRLRLRPIQESDKADRMGYGRDPEFRKMVGGDPRTSPPLTEAEVQRWFEHWIKEPLHWVIEAEDRCIGTALLHSLDECNRRARYAIGIFDPGMRNRGYGTEVTKLVLEYAFTTLKLHRVDLRALSFNQHAIACYERCGLVREGIEREGAFIGGEWHSDICMSILEQEWHLR